MFLLLLLVPMLYHRAIDNIHHFTLISAVTWLLLSLKEKRSRESWAKFNSSEASNRNALSKVMMQWWKRTFHSRHDALYFQATFFSSLREQVFPFQSKVDTGNLCLADFIVDPPADVSFSRWITCESLSVAVMINKCEALLLPSNLQRDNHLILLSFRVWRKSAYDQSEQ